MSLYVSLHLPLDGFTGPEYKEQLTGKIIQADDIIDTYIHTGTYLFTAVWPLLIIGKGTERSRPLAVQQQCARYYMAHPYHTLSTPACRGMRSTYLLLVVYR